MVLVLLSVAILVIGGFAALLGRRSARIVTGVGVGGAVIGCAIGLIPAAGVLLCGEVETLHLAWSVPYGSFFVQLDALSAFFIVVILAIS